MLPQVTSSLTFVPEDIEASRVLLSEFRDGVSSFVREHEVPSANSTYAIEQSGPHADTLRSCYGQASLLVEVAADHLTAFLKTITQPVETLAPWSCARALLETSAVGIWLFDSRISALERATRSVQLRYEGLMQQKKYVRAAKRSLDHVEGRLADALNQAGALGLRIETKPGGAVKLAQAMPAVTVLIRDCLGDEAAYRLLSAVTHGHHWATSQAGFRLLPAERAGWAGYRGLEKSPMLNGLVYVAWRASRAFARIVDSHVRYAGWPYLPFAALKERVDSGFDEIRAEASRRSLA